MDPRYKDEVRTRGGGSHFCWTRLGPPRSVCLSRYTAVLFTGEACKRASQKASVRKGCRHSKAKAPAIVGTCGVEERPRPLLFTRFTRITQCGHHLSRRMGDTELKRGTEINTTQNVNNRYLGVPC